MKSSFETKIVDEVEKQTLTTSIWLSKEDLEYCKKNNVNISKLTRDAINRLRNKKKRGRINDILVYLVTVLFGFLFFIVSIGTGFASQVVYSIIALGIITYGSVNLGLKLKEG